MANVNFIVMQKLYPVKQLVNSEFRENNLVVMCAQLLDVLEFMHSLGWTHNDIKYDNIMVDNLRNFYLIDFGLVTSYIDAKEEPADVQFGGTVRYMSIDVHRGFVNPPRGDLVNLVFVIKTLLGLDWDTDKHAFSLRTSTLIEKERFAENPECKEFTPFAVQILAYEYTDTPNYQRLKGILPTQTSIVRFKKFFERHSGIKFTFSTFSIIFQTQILPFIYRLDRKLYAILSLNPNVTEMELHEIVNMFPQDTFSTEYSDVLPDCGKSITSQYDRMYTDLIGNYVDSVVSSWVIHLTKLLKQMIAQHKEPINCTIQRLTQTIVSVKP